MKVTVEWSLAPPALSLDALAAQDPLHHFLYNDILYTGVLRLELLPMGQGTCYVVVALGASTPSKLLGSSMVTPVIPRPSIPLALRSPRAPVTRRPRLSAAARGAGTPAPVHCKGPMLLLD
jgi:hypothetical protein